MNFSPTLIRQNNVYSQFLEMLDYNSITYTYHTFLKLNDSKLIVRIL
jgi:hypothetical protein